MRSTWISLPPPPVLVAKSEPFLVPAERLPELVRYVRSGHANSVAVDLAGAEAVADVILALKGVLPFPDWCGNSWDSVEDAFEDLREAWSFPLVLVVTGLQSLVEHNAHLGLQTVLQLGRLSSGFSVAGDQFVVTYVVHGSWEKGASMARSDTFTGRPVPRLPE